MCARGCHRANKLGHAGLNCQESSEERYWGFFDKFKRSILAQTDVFTGKYLKNVTLVITLSRGGHVSAIDFQRQGFIMEPHNATMKWQVSAVQLKTMVIFSL